VAIDIVDGSEVECGADDGGPPPVSGEGAPTAAEYWLGEAHAELPNAHSLEGITGLVLSTEGIPSEAVGGLTSGDYSTVFVGATVGVALGTASAGVASTAARADHVHPTTGLVLATRSVLAGAGLTGGGALSADLTLGLASVGPGAGTIGGGGNVVTSVTLDAQGRVTAATSAAPAATGYTTIENPNGTPLTQRQIMAFSSAFSTADVTDTTNIDLANAGVGLAKIEVIDALSVVGNRLNTSAVPDDSIQTTAGSNMVLRENANQLTFGLLIDANVDSGAGIQHTKLAYAATGVLGRAATGSGALGMIGVGGALDGDVLTVQSDGTIAWEAASGGGTIDGSGTATHLASWTDSDTLQASGVTLASNILTHAASSSGGTVSSVVSNTSNTASSKALISTLVAGTTADDAYYTAAITGSNTFAFGVDNSATGDPFVLSAAATLGTNNILVAHANNTDGVTLQTVSGTGAKLTLTDATARLQNSVNEYLHIDSTFAALVINAQYCTRFDTAGGLNNVAFFPPSAGSYGGGVGVINVNNATTAPSSNPAGGGILYASGGALYWRGSSGTVTELAVP
jgi:hypothetical protein